MHQAETPEFRTFHFGGSGRVGARLRRAGDALPRGERVYELLNEVEERLRVEAVEPF